MIDRFRRCAGRRIDQTAERIFADEGGESGAASACQSARAFGLLASTDGEPVALHDFGGDGPVLLLSHGNGLNAGMWAAVVPHLRPSFHCYGIDLRGHGVCRPVDPAYDVDRERFADDILTCVDALGGGPFAYAGHSLGGAAVVHAALRRPEAFDALWLFEPVVLPEGFEPPGGFPEGPSMLVEATRRRRYEFASVDDAFERLSSKPPFSTCDPVAVRAYVEIGTYPVGGGVRLSCHPEDEARVFESARPIDLARLGSVQVPTVVATGQRVSEVNALPPLLAGQLADALGNARLEHHPDASHFGPMETPAAVASSIASHLTNG